MSHNGFWAGKKVLITGHTGLKGAWAWAWLERMGAHVSGLALAPETSPNLAEILGLTRRPSSHLADIRDAGQVRRIIDGVRPEFILHMAAQALVRRSYREPVETFDTNVRGTLHVLDAIRALPEIKACLVVTSDKVYENNDLGRRFKEEDALGGADPYSASKAACEIATASFVKSFFSSGQHKPGKTAVATARAGNVIGGGDWSEDRIIPDLWRARQKGAQVELRYPQATRPWQHVLDPIAGYFKFMEMLSRGLTEPTLNFGPTDEAEITVENVVASFQSAYGAGNSEGWRKAPGDHPKEAKTLAIDAGRAVAQLGWQPQLRPQEAIRWTADWYAAFDRGEDMAAFTDNQISAYESR
jgi:CDP-glucose 4,6-dehydratase